MTIAREFYILSLKWTRKRDGLITWWRPNESDYCYRLEWAGRYSNEQVEKQASYYNDGVHTIAIPCEVVDAFAIKVRDSKSRYLASYQVPDDHVVEYRHIVMWRPRKKKEESERK